MKLMFPFLRFLVPFIGVVAGLSCFLPGWGMAGDSLLGKVEVQQGAPFGPGPSGPPSRVYVRDFELEAGQITPEQHAVEQPRVRRLMDRVRSEADPAEKAGELVRLMSKTLVEALCEGGMPAEYLSESARMGKEGWLVHGLFTEVGEGNRVKRAVIGVGRGATSMEVQVLVSDLAHDPSRPFVVLGTIKNPGELPGAVATLNPYVAAANFVMAKNATEKDVQQTAR
ncbi:MAG: DUF4410 domain-containing protein, partial [Lentisphaerota bacterium]